MVPDKGEKRHQFELRRIMCTFSVNTLYEQCGMSETVNLQNMYKKPIEAS